jgi:hypothetical protein
MDSFLLWLGVGGAGLLLVAIVTAWWEHVKRLAEIREQLAWSENSRFALEAHAREVDAKLLAMNSVLQAQQHPAPHSPTLKLPSHAAASAIDALSTPGAIDARATPGAPDALAASGTTRPTASQMTASSGRTGIKAGITALAAAGSAVSAVLSSRAELEEMAQQPSWQDTEPMVLTTQTFDFEPTQTFDFEPTQPVDLSHH